jgi:hypothetical protein
VRTLMSVAIPVEQGNKAVKDGSLARILQSVLQDLQPEAAYFAALNGVRTALIFFDLKESSDLPRIAEPLFQGFNATVDFCPAMNADDLRAGLDKTQF